MNMLKIKFFTLGCKVNQYETQVMREQFLRAGFKELENRHPADIYVINTCTVTQRADSESLFFIRRAYRENQNAKIIVTGCLAELDSDTILEISGDIHIIRNKDKHNIFHFLNGLNGHNGFNGLNGPNNQIPRLATLAQDSFVSLSRGHNEPGISHFKDHTRAFIKIQDGCNNSCSYCKVPLVRGRSRSRPLCGIIDEAKQLAQNGFKEIVLCGICLGAYGRDLVPKMSLLDAINELEEIEGLLRIRLSSIEATDITEELINKIAGSKKLCNHLHIPLQSGDNEILRKMNRAYLREDYLRIIKRIKQKIPEIAITTDVLVGFPEENAVNFRNTVDLIRQIIPLKVHIFPYSQRKGTTAAQYEWEIDQRIIKERCGYLRSVAQFCSIEFKRQFLNKNMDVLIEGQCKEKPRFWEGHTDNYLKVRLETKKSLENELISLKLKEIQKNYILAEAKFIDKSP